MSTLSQASTTAERLLVHSAAPHSSTQKAATTRYPPPIAQGLLWPKNVQFAFTSISEYAAHAPTRSPPRIDVAAARLIAVSWARRSSRDAFAGDLPLTAATSSVKACWLDPSPTSTHWSVESSRPID